MAGNRPSHKAGIVERWQPLIGSSLYMSAPVLLRTDDRTMERMVRTANRGTLIAPFLIKSSTSTAGTTRSQTPKGAELHEKVPLPHPESCKMESPRLAARGRSLGSYDVHVSRHSGEEDVYISAHWCKTSMLSTKKRQFFTSAPAQTKGR
jgi:hypothetical protein